MLPADRGKPPLQDKCLIERPTAECLLPAQTLSVNFILRPMCFFARRVCCAGQVDDGAADCPGEHERVRVVLAGRGAGDYADVGVLVSDAVALSFRDPSLAALFAVDEDASDAAPPEPSVVIDNRTGLSPCPEKGVCPQRW